MAEFKKDNNLDEPEILSNLLTEIKKLNSALKPPDKESKVSNDAIVVIPEQDEQNRGSVVFDRNEFNQMIYNKVIKLEAILNEMLERWLLIKPTLDQVKDILSSYHKIDTMEKDITVIKTELSQLNEKIKSHKTFSQIIKEKSELSDNFTKVFKFIFYLLLALYLIFNVMPEIGTIIKVLNGVN